MKWYRHSPWRIWHARSCEFGDCGSARRPFDGHLPRGDRVDAQHSHVAERLDSENIADQNHLPSLLVGHLARLNQQIASSNCVRSYVSSSATLRHLKTTLIDATRSGRCHPPSGDRVGTCRGTGLTPLVDGELGLDDSSMKMLDEDGEGLLDARRSLRMDGRELEMRLVREQQPAHLLSDSSDNRSGVGL